MKARISEIFRSIQGEGKYFGVPQVFVRFFGCPLTCAWCDTPYARDPKEGKFREMTSVEIFKEITCLWNPCHSVSLTGGEPLMQKDFLKEFLPALKECGRPVYLDTNGVDHTALREVINNIDTIAMDIKLPSSARCRPYWDEHRAFLRVAAGKDVFVKTVITADTLSDDVARAARVIAEVDAFLTLVLQPASGERGEEALKTCAAFQNICLKTLSDVRIVPQMHKVMGWR